MIQEHYSPDRRLTIFRHRHQLTDLFPDKSIKIIQTITSRARIKPTLSQSFCWIPFHHIWVTSEREFKNIYYMLDHIHVKKQSYLYWGDQWCNHNDVIKWKHFPRYWPFVRGIHRAPVNSPHKGQLRGALMFPLICAWIDGWVNNREAGDLRRHCGH